MLRNLEITKSEYLSILRNRGKSVSPSISYDKLLKKLKYLKKRDLIHLLTIRGIVIDEYSLDSIIDALLKNIHKKNQANIINELYRYHHKQKLKNLKQEIYRTFHKRQNQLIINELKELKLSNLINKGSISLDDLKEISRLNKLSCNTLIRLAQLRNIKTTGLKKSDLIYILTKSQDHHKETRYLKYLQVDPINEIKSKINEIRKYIIELGMSIYKSDKDIIRKRLNEIDRKTSINRAEKTKLLNELSKILLDLEYQRKHIGSAYDSSDYYGLKDLEYTFGDLDDYYKPILAASFNDNQQMYTCRDDKDRDMNIDIYLDKVRPYLIDLIDEKKLSDQNIQLDIAINLSHIT